MYLNIDKTHLYLLFLHNNLQSNVFSFSQNIFKSHKTNNQYSLQIKILTKYIYNSCLTNTVCVIIPYCVLYTEKTVGNYEFMLGVEEITGSGDRLMRKQTIRRRKRLSKRRRKRHEMHCHDARIVKILSFVSIYLHLNESNSSDQVMTRTKKFF